ncbi:MAG: response regulator [Chloroflexota bacterium]|nr:response regulator [Chloroflexota bacterium]
MRQLHAIIIEDEADVATIFSEALKTGGFTTEVIYDGAEAMARLDDLTPDIIILDLHLPNVGGREILTRIRAIPKLAKTQILVTTADSQLAEMVEPEADLVLLKPISFLQLQTLAQRLATQVRGEQ